MRYATAVIMVLCLFLAFTDARILQEGQRRELVKKVMNEADGEAVARRELGKNNRKQVMNEADGEAVARRELVHKLTNNEEDAQRRELLIKKLIKNSEEDAQRRELILKKQFSARRELGDEGRLQMIHNNFSGNNRRELETGRLLKDYNNQRRELDGHDEGRRELIVDRRELKRLMHNGQGNN